MKILLRDFVSTNVDVREDSIIDLDKGVLYFKVDGITYVSIRKGMFGEEDLVMRYWSEEDKSSFEHTTP